MKQFFVLSVLAALMACGPSKVSSDGGTAPLTEEETDASVSVPESDGGEVLPDADAGIDAGVVDAGCVQYPAIDTTAQGPLTVTVYNSAGQFDLSAYVVHHHADGSVASFSRVNSNGQASFSVTGGDSISVAREYNYANQVFTWLAVQPGDNLVAGVSKKPVRLSPWGMARLNYPGTFAGAAGYRASVGCEDSYTAISNAHPSPILFLDKPCNGLNGNEVPIWGAALDAQNRMLAYVANPRLGLTLSSTQGYIGTYQPSVWKTDFITVTATATDLIPIERLEASAEWLTSGNERFSLPVTLGTTVGTHEVRVPRGLGALYHHLFAVNVPERARGTRRVNVLKAQTPPTSWGGSTKDWFMPELTGSTAAVVPESPGQRDITWESQGCMKDVHAILMTTRWLAADTDTRWTVIAPATHGPVRLPKLPPELSAYAPPQAEVLAPSLAFIHSSKLAGYNDMRARFTELPKVRDERLLDRTLFPGVEHELRFSILF